MRNMTQLGKSGSLRPCFQHPHLWGFNLLHCRALGYQPRHISPRRKQITLHKQQLGSAPLHTAAVLLLHTVAHTSGRLLSLLMRESDPDRPPLHMDYALQRLFSLTLMGKTTTKQYEEKQCKDLNAFPAFAPVVFFYDGNPGLALSPPSVIYEGVSCTQCP